VQSAVETIHPTLRRDCKIIGRFALCHLLLMNDAQYPWFILVPDRPDISELHHLTEADQRQLLHESSLLARILEIRFHADKINIAALGNVVPQLHVHHVARYRNDPAWPGPVWGALPAEPYSESALAEVMKKLKASLPGDFQYCWT